jgi:hypothetical protein
MQITRGEAERWRGPGISIGWLDTSFFDARQAKAYSTFAELLNNQYLCGPAANGEREPQHADVAKLVDALDLGSSSLRCVGSSPSIRTFLLNRPLAR